MPTRAAFGLGAVLSVAFLAGVPARLGAQGQEAPVRAARGTSAPDAGVQEAHTDYCSPLLVRAAGTEASLDRLRAIREGRGRVAFRSPYLEPPPCSGGEARAAAAVRAGGATRVGELRFLEGRPPNTPPGRVPDRTGPAAGIEGRGALAAGATLTADLFAFEGEPVVRELALVGVAGAFYGWAGRRAPGYGAGVGGGIVLDGSIPLDGVGVGLRRPFRLPGRLAGAGEWDFETFLAKAGDNAGIGRPWFLGGRWTWSPRPVLTLGMNRGAMFGGDGAPRITFARFLNVLYGGHRYEDGELVQSENQVASLDAIVRPSIAGVPTLLYLEVGFEDTSGAWARSPGIVSGIELAVPNRRLRTGIERTYLSRENGHGLWYRHSLYRAGWTDRGRILGHPLGGAGTEWLAHAAAHDEEGRWDARLGVRTRERLADNSLSPDLEGRAFGGFARGRLRTGPVDLVLEVDGERVRGGGDALSGFVGLRWARGPIP